MENLEVTKENAVKAYQEADGQGKALLATLFGKKTFLTAITDRINTFADCCAEVDLDPEDPRFTTGTQDDIAYQKLKLAIVPALNGSWRANYNNNEQKWWPIFYLDFPGFRFAGADCGFTSSVVSGGSRLAFASRQLAEHAAKCFEDVFRDFYC